MILLAYRDAQHNRESFETPSYFNSKDVAEYSAQDDTETQSLFRVPMFYPDPQ